MATVYVKKTGNDGNSGTRDAPVLTVQKAAYMIQTAAEANSEIIIMDSGIYSEGLIGQNAGTPVSPTITVSGLTIMAETGSNGLPLVTPVIEGSGSGNTQRYAFYCSEGWTIKGLTFQNYDIENSTDNAVITNRSPGNGDDGITVELCTFRHITGSCITFSRGSFLPNRHFVKSNTFHNITTKSSQKDMVIISDGTTERKATVINNVFYDWQPQQAGATFILGGSTNSQLPEIIISHNTFGTSSVEALGGSTTRAQYGVVSPRSKFEYNIIKDQTMAGSNASFAQIDSGEANYNINFNVAGTSAHAPFGRAAAPTSSVGNITSDPLFVGPEVGDSANYRLSGISSPAFNAAAGSSDVTKDRTALARTFYDPSGIFDIGAFEFAFGGAQLPEGLPQIGPDFTINRNDNASSNYTKFGVDQVPFSIRMNGIVPYLIRENSQAYIIEKGKTTNN